MGAKIYNSNLTKEIIDGARLQQQQGGIPSELAEKVIPVMEVNPKLLKAATIIKSAQILNNSPQTIYTTPTDKDFYLTNVALSTSKDVTATSIVTALSATVNGITGVILRLCTLTLTAERGEMACSLNPPIKVDPGSAITITTSTNVGNIAAAGSIVGYLEDNTTA